MQMLSRRSFVALGGAATIGVGAYAALALSQWRAEGATTLMPQMAHASAATGEILLVDIRRPDEWNRTGIPEFAVPIDLRDEAFLAKLQRARASETQPVAVICARGVRSARITRQLEAAGIGPLVDVPEGMLGSTAGPGWLDRGLPITRVN